MIFIIIFLIFIVIIGVVGFILESKAKKVRIYLGDGATPPMFATDRSSGMDIYTSSSFVIKPGKMHIHDTNVVVDYELMNSVHDCCLDIYPRSSLSAKRCVILGNSIGLIDPDYNGSEDHIKLILINLSDEEQTFTKGERIAQLVFKKVIVPKNIEIRDIKSIGRNRNRGGLGSSGR
jgi:dUTP pyrophosphatase